MGINGLLPLLKSIQKPCHIKNFAGQTIGIDAYGWLHRGTVACAIELATRKPTRKFVDFAMHRVRMLLHFGVTPFLIFDGDYLPSKASTEDARSKRREESRRAGLELLRAGKTSQAHAELQKAVDVTPEMARQLIDELKKANVQYIVAPYEADAQMVYLERKGIISGILSEDSDLLVFGAKCLLTKLDQYGNCIEVNRRDFAACRQVTLTGWSDREFRHMAILSGCDYLDNITNMGLKTAHRMLRKYKTVEKVVQMLQFEGRYNVPKGYLEAFYMAEHTFLYQRVYCPEQRCMTFHTDPGDSFKESEMSYIGAYLDPEIVRGIATGHLNPMTKQPIVIVSVNGFISRNHFTAAQSQLPASTSEAKKPKPLDCFFKPRRIPLAELDPNSFSLSKSQREVLGRNSESWEADPAPRPNMSASTDEPSLPPPRPLGNIRRIQHERTPSLTTTTTTELRPSKRARLCAEDVDETGTAKNTATQSPFFASSFEGTGSKIRKDRARKSKSDDFTIFSDASVEEAMRSLPDIETTQAKPEKPEFASSRDSDPNEICSAEKASKETTALSSSTTFVQFDSIGRPSIAANTPVQSTPKNITSLKPRLSSSATPVTSQPMFRNGLPTPPSSIRGSRIPLAVKTQSGSKTHHSPIPSCSTPLQKLGVAAISRFRMPPTPQSPATPISARNTASIMLKSSTVRHISAPSVPFPEVEKLQSLPTEIPLPAPDEREEILLSGGSEDLIIPDSDAEEDDDAVTGADDHPDCRMPLNLDRFTFRAS